MTETRNASPDTLGGSRDQSMGLEWLSSALFRRGIEVEGFATPAVAAVVALDHYRAERDGNPLANVAALYAAPSPKGETDGGGDHFADAGQMVGTATDDLVDRFCVALKDKLRAAEAKYGWNDGWLQNDWRDDCIADLNHHIAKGDPRDVAAFCAFAWHHGWSTSAALSNPAQALPDDGNVALRAAAKAVVLASWTDRHNRIHGHQSIFDLDRVLKALPDGEVGR